MMKITKKVQVILLFMMLLMVSALRTNADSVLNDNDKIKEAVDGLLQNVKNVDFENAMQYIDENDKDNVENVTRPVSDFIMQYPSSKDDIVNILSKIEYEIKNIEKVDSNLVKVEINFTFPDYQNIIEKCKVQIIAKNALRYITNGFKLDNEILSSSLNIISKEIDKDKNIPNANFNYSLNFKNVGGKYKLQNLPQIYNDIEKVVSSKISNVLK